MVLLGWIFCEDVGADGIQHRSPFYGIGLAPPNYFKTPGPLFTGITVSPIESSHHVG